VSALLEIQEKKESKNLKDFICTVLIEIIPGQ
jgi:hypothetical protein